MAMTNYSLLTSSFSSLQYPDDGVTEQDNTTREIIDAIQQVASPIIISVGLVGSVVGTASLLTVAGLRRRGMGHLLVAICVSDAIFLASVLPMWLGRRYGPDYDLYNRDGWCELLSLTTMSSNFLATWFTVTLGVERCVAVRHICRQPVDGDHQGSLKSPTKTFCGPTRTRVAIIGITILAVVVFVNMVVNIGVVRNDEGVGLCVPLQPAVDAMHVLNNDVDLVVNVIAPNLIIVGLYTAVGVRLSVWRCSRLEPSHHPGEDERAVCLTEVRLTRTAFLLSAVVVLLSTPSNAVRAAYIVAGMFRLADPPQMGGDVLQLVVRQLSRASFAVPFFVVVASHARIRRSIVLSMRLTLESAWRQMKLVLQCDSCCWQSSPVNVELQLESTAATSDTNR